MADFKLISESESYATYAYKSDYDDLSVSFDKNIKAVHVSYAHFVFKEASLEPQWRAEENAWLKHSCKYGHWQHESIVTLSAEDIEFINNKCRELFGK